MSTPSSDLERLVVALAREVQDGDEVVVGVGTPVALAAVLLARELHAPDVRILMPGALNPTATNLADYLVAPWQAGYACRSRLSRMDILDAIRVGNVAVQFVRPAQIDRLLRINTELISTDQGDRYVVGPVALPDVVHLVRRVIAYLPRHEPRALVEAVDTVTAPRPNSAGAVARLITPIATIERRGPEAEIVAMAPGWSCDAVAALTGFALHSPATSSPAVLDPTTDELDCLRTVIDPIGLAAIEDSRGRQSALAQLGRLWDTDGSAPRQEATP